MSTDPENDADGPGHLPHGQLGYLQPPALDLARAARFYQAVFDWRVEHEYASFEAPALIGQWTRERAPAPDAGPLLWIHVDDLTSALRIVQDHGGTILQPPAEDGPARTLATVGDPEGNAIGLVQYGPH